MARQFTEDFFCVYGFAFSFCTNHSEARDPFVRLYRRFLTSDTKRVAAEALLESNRDGFLWRFRERTATSSDLGSALLGLESALCDAIIRSQRSSIAVHAAAVYSADSAIMLAGPSGAGKSTLSVALSQRGLTVATDDASLVERETLSILPIPRPFHLDNRSVLLLEGEGLQFPQVWTRLSFMSPIDFDERSIPRWRAGFLIYVARPRAGCPLLKRVSQSEMAARLLSETGQGPLSDSETVRVLSRICSGASCFTLVPGPFAQTVDALADLIPGARKESTASRRREHGIAVLQ